MPELIETRNGARAAGSWRLELRFQATRDEEADWSHFWPSIRWLSELGPRDQERLCEGLRRRGLALLACEGPEEAARRLSGIRGRRVTARVLEPDGTELQVEQGTGKDRGVYATPRPLTRFVVRCVDSLLRSRLGLKGGLANRAVRLLDPAAGPMNFVLEAYRRAAAEHRRTHGGEGLEEFIQEHLIPHFQGLEILPGPWAEGQSELRRWVSRRNPEACPPRFPLFLADALASPGPSDRKGFLEREAESADRLRLEAPFSVVLGNPPFRGRSANQGSWIRGLLRGYELEGGRTDEGYFALDGRPLGERNVKWLQDDYVKFLRLAQWIVDRNGEGIVGFVVNHNCLEAPTFRGLRRSLLRTFDQVFALDLHGNRRRRETGPAGQPDENIFEGVAQGIAVLLLVKGGQEASKAIYRADLYGSRREKLRTLAGASLQSLPWSRSEPGAPLYLFRSSDAQREREYRRGLALDEMFPVHSLGVVTGRDSRALAFQREDFEAGLTAPARRCVTGFLFRPFDVRHVRYESGALERPRTAVMSHFQRGGNLGLLALRQGTQEKGAFVTRGIAGHKVVDSYAPNTVFPLFLTGAEGQVVPNLGRRAQESLAAVLEEPPGAEEVFGYAYAMLHDACYLFRFREPLRTGFPHIPLPESREGFLRRARLGRELASLHLLEDRRLAASPVRLDGDPRLPPMIDRTTLIYDETAGRVRLNRRGLSFDGIAPEVWRYRVGSYQVLIRWLKARAGHNLSLSAIREFRWIAEAVRRSLEVQQRIQEI
jgi:predicted helicase